MIPIKINKKKYKIKPLADLTVEEFIEVSQIENLDVIKYISWATGIDTKDAFFAEISYSVEKAIGKMPDYENLPVTYDMSCSIETVGQRYQIESSNLKGAELILFVLAVGIAKSNNIDHVYKVRDELLEKKATDVIPSALFFFKILEIGSKKGGKYLLRIRRWIRTKVLRKAQGYYI